MSVSAFFGEPIYSYSRAQAIADGFLVDITKIANQAGFSFPTVVTAAVYSIVRENASPADSVDGRLWDIVSIAALAMKGARSRQDRQDRVNFEVIVGPRTEALCVHIGPGDTPAPVLTILVQGED